MGLPMRSEELEVLRFPFSSMDSSVEPLVLEGL